MPFKTGIGMDENIAESMGLLQGLQGLGPAGLQRTASPAGSIAQNLMPIFSAILQAKAMQQQAAAVNAQAAGQQALQRLQIMAKMAAVNPEKQAAEVEHLKALAESERALSEQRKGQGQYREQQQKLLEQLLGGQSAGAPIGGMKPTITYGSSGPSVSYKSDVMSPEAFEQQKRLAGMRAGESLSKEKELAQFKQSLPPKLTDKDVNTISSGRTLLSLMDSADTALGSIPKDISDSEYARNAAKYQARSEHPTATNLLSGYTGGLVNFETDSKLDPAFSWIGQVQSALTTFNLQGMRGGYQTLQYLKDHFPGYGDSPAQAKRKLEMLKKDKAVVQQRLSDIEDFFNQKGTKLEAPGTVEHETQDTSGFGVSWMGRPYVTKSGEKRRVWLNPATGENKDLPEGQMPGPIPDMGLR